MWGELCGVGVRRVESIARDRGDTYMSVYHRAHQTSTYTCHICHTHHIHHTYIYISCTHTSAAANAIESPSTLLVAFPSSSTSNRQCGVRFLRAYASSLISPEKEEMLCSMSSEAPWGWVGGGGWGDGELWGLWWGWWGWWGDGGVSVVMYMYPKKRIQSFKVKAHSLTIYTRTDL